MEMLFLSSQMSLPMSNDFFSEKYKYTESTVDKQLCLNSLRILSPATKYKYFCGWKLQTVVRAYFSLLCDKFLHCTVKVVLSRPYDWAQ